MQIHDEVAAQQIARGGHESEDCGGSDPGCFGGKHLVVRKCKVLSAVAEENDIAFLDDVIATLKPNLSLFAGSRDAAGSE